MTEWAVSLTILGEIPLAMDDRLADYGAIIAGDETSWTLDLTIEASDPIAAATGAASLSGSERGALLGTSVVEADALEEQLACPAYPELVGVSELAALLGVSKQRASELQRRPGFPRPLQVLASGPVWPRGWVDQFVADWERKVGRPRKAS